MISLAPVVRRSLAAAIGAAGFEFCGPPRFAGEASVRRQGRVWFQLIDRDGQPLTATGQVRVRLTLTDEYSGYLSLIAADEWREAVAPGQARTGVHGPRYMLPYPESLLLTPEWPARYVLDLWFEPAGGPVLHRQTTAVLDPAR